MQQLQYPWKPHNTNLLNRELIIQSDAAFNSPPEAISYLKSFLEMSIDEWLSNQINDTIHLSVQNALKHTTNQDTLSLATARIPSSVTSEDTLRFLIAFLYEKQIGVQRILDLYGHTIYLSEIKKYVLVPQRYTISISMVEWTRRADKIVEIMQTAPTKVGELSRNADAIRNAALIDLGEKTGLQLTSLANKISFNIGETSDQGNTISRTLAPNTSFFVEKASDFRIAGTRANNTDTLTLTSKNGPNEITVTANNVPVTSVLAKDATKTLVNAELMGSVVSTQPILLPVATRELPDIGDLEVAEVQSVNLIGLFTGLRVNVTASSADENIATVSVNDNTTSMGVTGVAIGTTKITVTGTNEAGAVSVDFNLTIIAASD